MNDYMIRATAAEGQIRAFAATTRDMVENAKNAHNTSPVATAALGRLMTAAAMMGADLKGEKDLLTLRIEGSGPLGGLLVTANGHGDVKGYAFNPGASDEIIDKIEAKLSGISSITALLNAGKTPEEILTDILGEFGLEILSKMPVQFHCDCDRSRVEKAIISIGKKEIQDMINEGREIEVNCQFCNKHYKFSVDELEDMLKRATRE